MPIFGYECTTLSCLKFAHSLEILYSSQIKKLIPREVKIADRIVTQYFFHYKSGGWMNTGF